MPDADSADSVAKKLAASGRARSKSTGGPASGSGHVRVRSMTLGDSDYSPLHFKSLPSFSPAPISFDKFEEHFSAAAAASGAADEAASGMLIPDGDVCIEKLPRTIRTLSGVGTIPSDVMDLMEQLCSTAPPSDDSKEKRRARSQSRGHRKDKGSTRDAKGSEKKGSTDCSTADNTEKSEKQADKVDKAKSEGKSDKSERSGDAAEDSSSNSTATSETLRTFSSARRNILVQHPLLPFLHDAARFYAADSWTKVTRAAAAEHLNQPSPQVLDASSLPSLPYELDLEVAQIAKSSEFKSSEELTSELVKSNITHVTAQKAIDDERARGGAAISLFKTAVIDDTRPLDEQSSGEPWAANASGAAVGKLDRLLVEVKSFGFDASSAGDIEPHFASLTLVDAKRQLRLSETFQFDTNDEKSLKNMAFHRMAKVPAILRAKKVLLSLATPAASEDVFLVLMVRVVLRGDLEETATQHSKYNALKPKDRAKVDADVKEYCERLGEHRQLLCFAAVRVFGAGVQRGGILPLQKDLMENDGTVTVKSFMRLKSGGDFWKQLSSYVDALDRGNKSRSFPAACELIIKRVIGKDVENATDPVLNRLAPFPDKNGDDPDVLVRELREFNAPDAIPRPLVAFVHELYVHPISVNFSNYKKIDAKNICVEFRLMESDRVGPLQLVPNPGDGLTDGDASASVQCILGSNGCGSEWVRHARSGVAYHVKKPKFVEEIKLKLPAVLTPQHHLLVTFYQVSVALKKLKGGSSPNQVLGHSVVPLLDEKHNFILDDNVSGRHYPVALSLPANYRAPEVQETLSWLEGRKGVFSLRATLCSTVQPQDPRVVEFLTAGYLVVPHSLEAAQARYSELNALKKQDKKKAASVSKSDEVRMFNALRHLSSASSSVLVEFSPVLLRHLLRLICFAGLADRTSEEAFGVVAYIASSMEESLARDNILQTFVTYVADDLDLFTETQPSPVSGMFAPLYEQLLKVMIRLMMRRDKRMVQANKVPWLWFGLICKSLALHLDIRGQLGKSNDGRAARIPPSTVDLFRTFVLFYCKTVVEMSSSGFSDAKFLNARVAVFLRDLFGLLDRGHVFELVYSYARALDPKNHKTVLTDFKLHFLKVINDHEHFVAINAPRPVAESVSLLKDSISDVYNSWWQRHFLIGTLLHEMQVALRPMKVEDGAYGETSVDTIRAKAVQVLLTIMQKIDCDNRFIPTAEGGSAKGPEARLRIAAMFFPVLTLVCDNRLIIAATSRSEQRPWLLCFMWVLRNVSLDLLKTWWKHDTQKRLRDFLTVLGMVIATFEYRGADNAEQDMIIYAASAISRMQSENSRPDSAVSSSRSLAGSTDSKEGKPKQRAAMKAEKAGPPKKAPPAVPQTAAAGGLRARMAAGMAERQRIAGGVRSSPANNRLTGNLKTTEIQEYFEQYYGHTRTGSSGGDFEEQDEQDELTQQEDTADVEESMDEGASKTSRRSSGARGTQQWASLRKKRTIAHDAKHEQHLFHGISFVILEVVDIFMRQTRTDLISENSVFFDGTFSLLIRLLEAPQPVHFLRTLFTVISHYSCEHRKALFRYSNTVVEKLCRGVLRLCNSSVHVIRADANAVLFLLIDQNFREMKSFSRMKLQCTIAVSELVGTNAAQSKDELVLAASSASLSVRGRFQRLTEGLKAVAQRAAASTTTTSMGREVGEMVERLLAVVNDNERMAELRWDPEATVELLFQLANNYVDSPDLRVTWLRNLADYHLRNNQKEEAAQTKLLAAALVAGYLKLLGRLPEDIPDDFARVFPNVERERRLPTASTLEPLLGEICQGKVFTGEGFVNLLHEAIQMLSSGQLHESCVNVYQLLLPIHQTRRDFRKMSECYEQLRITCDEIIRANDSNERIFSNFYRVAFYGKNILKGVDADLHGKEYIFKELNVCRLAAFSERLKAQYASRVRGGEEKVMMLSGMKPVDEAALDPNILHLQILPVAPYFSVDELASGKRDTLFDQNFNVSRFLYETAFTKSGAAHGPMEEQCVRKTILTTESAFPHVKKRLLVTHREVVELSPIESATQSMAKMTQTIRNEASAKTINPKMLQMALQGSILAQVNAGPLEIVRVFLQGDRNTFGGKSVAKLGAQMKDFVLVIEDGVRKNENLITPDQIPLQQELMKEVARIRTEVSACVSFDEPPADE